MIRPHTIIKQIKQRHDNKGNIFFTYTDAENYYSLVIKERGEIYNEYGINPKKTVLKVFTGVSTPINKGDRFKYEGDIFYVVDTDTNDSILSSNHKLSILVEE